MCTSHHFNRAGMNQEQLEDVPFGYPKRLPLPTGTETWGLWLPALLTLLLPLGKSNPRWFPSKGWQENEGQERQGQSV